MEKNSFAFTAEFDDGEMLIGDDGSTVWLSRVEAQDAIVSVYTRQEEKELGIVVVEYREH